MPAQKPRSFVPADELLEMILPVAEEAGIESIRLTGGEPTLYPELEKLIGLLRNAGIAEVQLTTNGFSLARQAGVLTEAGLTSINISLDGADRESFRRMTRRDQFDTVVEGIKAAASRIPAKLNATIVAGKNTDQVVPLFYLARSLGTPLRYLELMAMGPMQHQAQSLVFTEKEILSAIASEVRFSPVPRLPSATARYWKTEDGFQFGIIANESAPFCSDCDRLRMDSEGKIYGCLSDEAGVQVKGATRSELRLALAEALSRKQNVRFKGSARTMLEVGG
jgi:cyclic pyranopterin phosphate synthase